jgi:uncharacterized protein HemY
VGRQVGLWLIGGGAVLVLAGLLTWSGALGWFGRLPGDIRIETEHARIYVPVTSMLVVSLILNVILWVFLWLFRR